MKRLAVIVLLVVAGIALAQDKLSKEETSTRTKVAKEWVELGKWCVQKKLGSEARICAARAQAAGGQLDATACPDSATDADKKEWPKRLPQVGKRVAALWDKLVALGPPPEKADEWLLAALEADPDPKRFEKVLAFAESLTKEKPRAVKIAERAVTLPVPEKLVPRFQRLVDLAAIEGLVLRTARAHPLKYYFSLPTSFERKKGKTWPILVCVDGAGSNFEGMGGGYRGARGDLPFIVVSPCTFSNTNAISSDAGQMAKYKKFYSDEVIADGDRRRIDWDEEGILAAIKDVQELYAGEPRVYVTGFSGGGNPTYMMVFKHPDLVAAAAPACANFSHPEYSSTQTGKFQGDDLAIPVHMITGEKDPHRQWTFGKEGSPGIEMQTDWAVKALSELGYKNTKRTMVPGLGHDAAVAQVLATFRPYVEGKKKRTDAP